MTKVLLNLIFPSSLSGLYFEFPVLTPANGRCEDTLGWVVPLRPLTRLGKGLGEVQWNLYGSLKGEKKSKEVGEVSV